MTRQLPAVYKSPLSNDTLSHVIYCFHSSDYTTLNETATFLILVVDHLKKQLREADEDISLEEVTISTFMVDVYEAVNFRSLMHKVKYHPGSDLQKKLIESMNLEYIYSFLEFFYNWLEKGFYNFSSVPRSFKQTMREDDRIFIDRDFFLQMKEEGMLSDLSKELQKLIGALKITQNELVKDVKDEAVSFCSHY